MKEFYVQLISTSSTTEFPSNQANSFKNRLPYQIQLKEEGWKVGLSSISYPPPPLRRYQQLANRPHLFEDDDVLLEFDWSIKTFQRSSNGIWYPSVYRVGFTVKGGDLRKDQVKVTSGKSLMRYLVNSYQHRLTEYMERENESLRAPDGKKYYVVFRWEGDSLIIDNTDTFLNENGNGERPKVWFSAELVKKMKWVEKTGIVDYKLSHHVIKSFKDDKVPAFKLDWVAQHNTHSTNFWNIRHDGSLQLSPYCNWRFEYLDELYDQHYGGNVTVSETLRTPMYVYCNVAQSTVMGNQVTDLLREVPHDQNTMTFEPSHIQYLSVRSDVFDIIETQVAENDGELVKFPLGVTTVTLHFKRDGFLRESTEPQ